MSLTLEQESQLTLRGENTVLFSRGGSVITSLQKIKQRRDGKKHKKELLAVLLEASPSLKGSAYRAIWECLRQDPGLRLYVSGSRQDITLEQVIAHEGFGLVAMTDPTPNHFVAFSYHPKHYDTGQPAWHGRPLHCCSLGTVVPTQ